VPDAHLGTLWVDIIARDSTFLHQIAKIGNKMSGLGLMLTKNVTLPIAAMGAIGYKAAAEIGKGYMLVARQLGYTGKALDKLMVRFRKVWRDVPEDSEIVAGVLINVEQRFDQTGKAADRMTKKVLDFARILGADPVTASRDLGMWFQQNEIRGKKQAKAMDMIALAAQRTGVPLDLLLTNLNAQSQMMIKLGFNYKEQIALFASFEKAGLGVENMSHALRMATASAAQEGFKTGEEGLRSFINEIKKAPNDMKATAIAIDIFGRLAGPKIAAAIRQGTFNIDKWTEKLEQSQGTVKKTADATMQLSDRMKMLGKKILGLFEPIGKIFIYAFEDIILPVLERAANYTDKWADSMDKVPRPILAAIGTMLTLIALVGPLMLILGWLGKFAILKYASVAAGIAGIYEFVFLKTAALAYAAGISMGVAFGVILLIILAVAAAIYVVIKNWDKFAKVFQPVMGSLNELWKTLKKTFGELWAILKPMLLPALKKLAIIVGIVLLGAFGGLAIILIILINIITAIIKGFIGLGKIIYGVSQILRGFFTGNRSLMAEGVRNMTDGANEIGGAMKDMVLDSGKQIIAVQKAVAEGTMAMMEEFMNEGEKKSAKGGEASARAFEDSSEDEHKKGSKKRYRMFDDRNRRNIEQERKGGKEAGKAYTESWEAEVLRKGMARALFDKGRRQQHKREIKEEKDHQRLMGNIRQVERNKEASNQRAHGGLIGMILRRSHANHTQEVARGHNQQTSVIQSIQGGLIGWLAGVPAKQAFAMRNNSAPLTTALVPALTGMVVSTQNIMLALARWLGGLPEHFANTVAAGGNFIVTMFVTPVTGAVTRFKNIITVFSDNYLAHIPRWFKNTILKNVREMWETGRKLAENMIQGFISRGREGSKQAGEDAGKKTDQGYKKGSKGLKKSGRQAGKSAQRGFKQGLKKGARKSGYDFGNSIVGAIRKRLGIKSPSTEFKAMGANVRRGFLSGINMRRMRAIMRRHFKAMVNEDTKIVKVLPRRIVKIFKAFNRWLARVPRMQRKAMLSRKAQHIQQALVPMYKKMVKNATNLMIKFGKWLKGWPKHASNLLKLNAPYMAEAGRVLASRLIDAVKKRLGIASPSREFQNIGSQMIMGLIKGMNFEQVMAIMTKNFGGIRGFAQHLFDFMNKHKGWDFLNEYLQIPNSEELYNALGNFLAPKPGAPEGGGTGELAGVPLVPGQALMQAIFNWLMAKVGGGHSITSGYRPGDPGHHGSGFAIDIAPGSDQIAGLASQLIGGPAGFAGGIVDNQFGELIWKSMIGGNHFDHVHFAILAISDFLRNLAAPKAPAPGAGGDVWSQVASYFSERGQGAHNPALHELLMRESGMNPQADNPTSDAWGLFQFMLNLHARPGGLLPKGMNSTLGEQIAAGFSYITGKYGNATNALAAHDRQNWYKGGGQVSATLHAGERVLTLQQNRWFSDLAQPLAKVAAGAGSIYNKVDVTATIPTGTKFKIINLREGMIETVGEGVDYYDQTKRRDLRSRYR